MVFSWCLIPVSFGLQFFSELYDYYFVLLASIRLVFSSHAWMRASHVEAYFSHQKWYFLFFSIFLFLVSLLIFSVCNGAFVWYSVIQLHPLDWLALAGVRCSICVCIHMNCKHQWNIKAKWQEKTVKRRYAVRT